MRDILVHYVPTSFAWLPTKLVAGNYVWLRRVSKVHWLCVVDGGFGIEFTENYPHKTAIEVEDMLGEHVDCSEPWFAWRPVFCNTTGKFIWLKKCQREHVFVDFLGLWYYRYFDSKHYLKSILEGKKP